MKANELIIGDWVNCRVGWENEETGKVEYETESMFPIQITCIYDGLVQYNEELYEGIVNTIEAADYELFPIPLTPEILEKNSFYWGYTATEEDFCGAVGCGYPDKGWCFDEGAGEIKILFPNESDGGLVRLDDQSGDRHLELVFAKPLMVHELQHALRLCGIEKEIII